MRSWKEREGNQSPAGSNSNGQQAAGACARAAGGKINNEGHQEEEEDDEGKFTPARMPPAPACLPARRGLGRSYANCAVTRVCIKTVAPARRLVTLAFIRPALSPPPLSASPGPPVVQISQMSYLRSPITQIIHSRYLAAAAVGQSVSSGMRGRRQFCRGTSFSSFLPRPAPCPTTSIVHSCLFFSAEAVCPSSAYLRPFVPLLPDRAPFSI